MSAGLITVNGLVAGRFTIAEDPVEHLPTDAGAGKHAGEMFVQCHAVAFVPGHRCERGVARVERTVGGRPAVGVDHPISGNVSPRCVAA